MLHTPAARRKHPATRVTALAIDLGVSLNQWIAPAVAQKVGAVETAGEFLRRRAGEARPEDLAVVLARAPDRAPDPGDELPEGWR
jgi:hypothetical protein